MPRYDFDTSTLVKIPLAAVPDLDQSFPVDHFVRADQRLCDVAILEGLAIINPA
jgi:hypothetical protein